MDIGMLWYDDDKHRTLEDKLTRAVNYYQAKKGVRPNAAYVNPKSMPPGTEGAVTVAGVELRGLRTIIKDHFWLVANEAKVKAVTP